MTATSVCGNYNSVQSSLYLIHYLPFSKHKNNRFAFCIVVGFYECVCLCSLY